MFANSFDDIVAFAKAMKEHGIKPEMECFDTGHTNSHRVLAELGLHRGAVSLLVHHGRARRHPGDARAISRSRPSRCRPARAGRSIGISREQWPLAMAALSLGGDVRVGLEDNFYLPTARWRASNGELVAAAAKLVKLSGRSVATVDEAKQLLWPTGGGP